MKITLVNEERIKDLYLNHGMFACTCYNTPDKHAEKVGKSCSEIGHMSGSRTEYFIFRIEGIDRGTAEQFMRHEIGVRYDNIDKYQSYDNLEFMISLDPSEKVNNMQSFRYVDKDEFDYSTPTNISKRQEIDIKYQQLMKHIDQERQAIRDMLIEAGVDRKRAIEDANFALPRATNLTLTIGFTPEAIIHFMHKRLCVRSQEFATKFARAMKAELKNIVPEFATKLVPHCEYLLWCPEGKMCCGYKPTKEQVEAQLKELKEIKKSQGDK